MNVYSTCIVICEIELNLIKSVYLNNSTLLFNNIDFYLNKNCIIKYFVSKKLLK